MQQRFHISYHPDYDAAQAAKKDIESKRPNDRFQIRKRAKNFELVGRVKINDAKIARENAVGVYAKKKKKPKKSWKKVPSLSPSLG